MKVCYIPYDGRETNDIAFSSRFNQRWTNILKDMLEREGHSISTYDINTIEDSDVILSFDNIYFQNVRHFMKIAQYKKLGQTIHIDYEPPSANCKIHDKKGLLLLSNLFKTLITYNDDVVNGDNIVKGCIADYFEPERPYKYDFKKRKLLCMIANYRVDLMLFGLHKDELYSKRKEAVEYFQDKCADDFSLYGAYWAEDYTKCLKGKVERENKMDTLSEYRFIISYDSLTNQRGYISEKVFDCFRAKIIPIYWGADNISDYVPSDCFIDKRDFKTYDELYTYLINMSEEEYNRRINAIEMFLASDQYSNLFSSYASAKILYDQIMKPAREIDYTKAESILSSFDRKRKKDYRYSFDNYYYDSSFRNSIDNFEIVFRKGEYNLKFSVKMSNEFSPKFIISSGKGDIYLEQDTELGNNYNSTQFNFYVPYQLLYSNKTSSFFVEDTNVGKQALDMCTNLVINQIHYNIENRVKAKGNVIKIIKTRSFYERLIREIPSLGIKKAIALKKYLVSIILRGRKTYFGSVLIRLLKLPGYICRTFVDIFR